MDIRQLQCFVAVGDELSFSRAGRRLHVGTSTVSQHIRRLERDLGAQLLYRTSRRVELTETGQRLHDQAREILVQITELRGLVRQAGTSARALSVAFCPGAGDLVGDLTMATAETLPGIALEFHRIRNAEVITELSAGHVDLGISRWTETGFSAVLLSSEPESALVMPCGHPLATKATVKLADLENEDVVIADRSANARLHYQQTRVFLDRGVRPHFRAFAIPDATAAMELVVAGNGCLLTTFSVATAHAPRGTTVRPVADSVPAAQHFLLWRQNDNSPDVTAFVNMACSLTSSSGDHTTGEGATISAPGAKRTAKRA